MSANLMIGCLGEYVPDATISWWPESLFSPAGWRIGSVANERDEVLYPSFEAAAAAAKVRGYKMAETSTCGHGKDKARLVHTLTQAALDAALAADAAKWAAARPCYVRYGDLPKGGRSRNHADGTWEAGVSVFRGERLPTGEARPLPGRVQELVSALSVSDRQLYVVTGTEVGLGSDGEPVLRNCRIVRRAPARKSDGRTKCDD